MTINNTSVFTSEELLKFSKKATLRQSRRSYISCAVFATLSILLFLAFSFNTELQLISMSAIFCAFIASCIFVYQVVVLLVVRKNLKSQSEVYKNGFTYEFTFTETFFNIKSISEETSYTAKQNYSSLYKVLGLDDSIVIYLSNANVFVAKKDGFKSEEDFIKVKNHLTNYNKRVSK
ncbi:MAG: hypothetical protein ACRC5M_04070 [Anaeroplasmataceae bacterium]